MLFSSYQSKIHADNEKNIPGIKNTQWSSYQYTVWVKQEKPAVADKPARRLRKVCTVYVTAVGL